MKRIEKINIAGFSFFVDEDAYDKIAKYISDIELKFKDEDGGNDIIQDIESRLAEIFNSMTINGQHPLTIENVTEAMAQMGDPNTDFSNDEGEKKASKRKNRRLYRDTDNEMLGGVCSGIAAYFNIDVVWVRLLFVLLFLFYIYIILWLVVPVANTAAKKLEMRGEPININNIRHTINKTYSDVKVKYGNLNTTQQILSAILVAISLLCILFIASHFYIGIPSRLVGIIGCVLCAINVKQRWLKVAFVICAVAICVGSCHHFVWYPFFPHINIF